MNYAETHYTVIHKAALNNGAKRLAKFSGGLGATIAVVIICVIFKAWAVAGVFGGLSMLLMTGVNDATDKWFKVRDAVIRFSCVEAAKKNPPAHI